MTLNYVYMSILAVPVILSACGPKMGGQGDEDSLTGAETGAATSAPATGDPNPTDPGDTSSATGGSEACAGVGPMVAVSRLAYTEANVPPDQDPTVGMGATTGPSELDPGTVILMFSDQLYTCADPQAELVCGNDLASILIPPEFQAPGVYSLNDTEVRGFQVDAEVFDNTGGPTCGHGGGTFVGTLVIDVFDASGVSGRLCAADSHFGDPPFQGTFSASRCP